LKPKMGTSPKPTLGISPKPTMGISPKPHTVPFSRSALSSGSSCTPLVLEPGKPWISPRDNPPRSQAAKPLNSLIDRQIRSRSSIAGHSTVGQTKSRKPSCSPAPKRSFTPTRNQVPGSSRKLVGNLVAVDKLNSRQVTFPKTEKRGRSVPPKAQMFTEVRQRSLSRSSIRGCSPALKPAVASNTRPSPSTKNFKVGVMGANTKLAQSPRASQAGCLRESNKIRPSSPAQSNASASSIEELTREAQSQLQLSLPGPLNVTWTIKSPSRSRIPTRVSKPSDRKSASEVQTPIEQLTSELKELELTAKLLSEERDFYFGKLRNVETMCKEQEAEGEQTASKVLDILGRPRRPRGRGRVGVFPASSPGGGLHN